MFECNLFERHINHSHNFKHSFPLAIELIVAKTDAVQYWCSKRKSSYFFDDMNRLTVWTIFHVSGYFIFWLHSNNSVYNQLKLKLYLYVLNRTPTKYCVCYLYNDYFLLLPSLVVQYLKLVSFKYFVSCVRSLSAILISWFKKWYWSNIFRVTCIVAFKIKTNKMALAEQ